jgi:glycosyltransferase involved in cell wall biosynthesis
MSVAARMRHGKRIGVVIPARNERARVGGVISGLPSWVDAVVVIDDASTDGTASAARAAGAAWTARDAHSKRAVEVLSHERNRGVGAAIVTGYEHALGLGIDVIAVMAGDGQMDPADLTAVVDPIILGSADYVKGNRFLHPERRRMPFLRRTAGRGLAWATRAATGLRIDDSQCGYTALSERSARTLPLRELWPRYGYPNDLLGLLAAARHRVVEVPVRPIYAGEASGIRPWHAVVVLGLIVRRWSRSRRIGP